jgi:C-terminal processing protease CtpA/Prc
MTLQLLKISTTDILSVDQMKKDLDFAYRKLLENHVNPYLYVSKVKLERLYKKIRSNLKKPLTRHEFYLAVSGLVTTLHDGHTAIDFPMTYYYEYEKKGLLFPLRVKMNKSGIFVAQNLSKDSKIGKGDQILSINGKSYSNIVTDFGTLINDVRPLYDVYSGLFNQLFWFKYGSAKEFQIEFRNQIGQVLKETIPGILKAEWKPSGLDSELDFDFEILEEGIGILTFNRMFKAKEFDHFLDSTFSVIKERKVNNLIIDIRKNGGGRGRMADSLFNYLTQDSYSLFSGIKYKISKDLKNLYLGDDPNHTDPIDSAFIMSQPDGVVADFLKHTNQSIITIRPHRKENVFTGKTFLLTSNNTFSGGALIAGIFKCNSIGKIIGVEPAQTTMFVADHTYVTLPNSKLDLGISFVELHLPCEQSYYHGIRPDYEIEMKAQDMKEGVDTQIDFVMKLIKGNK